MAEHAIEPDNPTRELPNPAWAKVNAQSREAHDRLDRLQAEYGLEAFTNLGKQRRTMNGFKIAQGKLGGLTPCIAWRPWKPGDRR